MVAGNSFATDPLGTIIPPVAACRATGAPLGGFGGGFAVPTSVSFDAGLSTGVFAINLGGGFAVFATVTRPVSAAA